MSRLLALVAAALAQVARAAVELRNPLASRSNLGRTVLLPLPRACIFAVRTCSHIRRTAAQSTMIALSTCCCSTRASSRSRAVRREAISIMKLSAAWLMRL